jgi:hypothetical protein
MGTRVVTVNDVLEGHVALDIQCLDRIYLNAYVPKLQSSGQVVAFLSDHLGYPFPSPALFNQIGQRFRRAVASFAEANDIPWVKFGKDDVGGKLELMRPYLARQAATGVSGVAAIGVAQEFQRVWTAYERETPTGAPQWWFTKADRRVTCYYFYLWDADFVPAFIKVCSYFPYPAKIWLNGHEWAKRQATQAGIGFTELSNGFATCQDPAALQEICDRLGPGTITVFVERWLARLPLPFTTKDRDAGYWWETSMRQIEISRTIVFDAPRHARGFFEALVADNLDLGRPHNVEIIFNRRVRRDTGRLPHRDRPPRQRWSDRQRVLQTFPDQAVPGKTAARCASKPSSTVPETWAARPACPISMSSRPKAVPATSESCMLKRVGQGCVLASPALQRIAHPTVDAAGRRTPALRFGDPRVMALTGALCQTLLAATGFTNKNLRVLITGLLGSDYRPNQMTYDLRRLRLAGLIRRLPHTNRYQLTPEGIRIAVFYTKIHNRMLVPLTAANQPQAPPNSEQPWPPSPATSTPTPPTPASLGPPENLTQM